MKDILEITALERSTLSSALAFEQVKVHFLYAFYLNGWRRLIHDFDLKRELWKETWGQNNEHRQLAWIAQQLGCRNQTLKSVNVHVADNSGTRPFLRRLDPYIEINLVEESLVPHNKHIMPELVKALGNQAITVAPTIRLYYSGFGIVCLKTNFLTGKGQNLAIREIVYSADDSRLPPLKQTEAELLIKKLINLVAGHSGKLPQQELSKCLNNLKDESKQSCIANRIANFSGRRTPVLQPLSPDVVIQISNLDRGTSPLHEPQFRWDGQKEDFSQPLYSYFVHVVNDLVTKPIADGLRRAGFKLTEPLNLCDRWHAENGQHPYVSIFLPEYGDPKDSPHYVEMAAAFRAHIENNRQDLARMLLRTSWTHVRQDWQPISEALENLFYSDLIHINTHLRSTLCYYYLPSSSKGFNQLPELRNSYKYREELGNIIGSQRLLWYAYNMFDDEASRSFRQFTTQFDELMESCIEEEDFKLVVNGLRDVVQAIDSFKTAVAQVMIDPQSRKGGSSLFTEILGRTTDAFHLPELYSNLRHKLDRLDMLGVHVTQALHECSQLRVAEGSRSTQFTLEFLEAIILAFYLTEMIEALKLEFIEAAGVNLFIPLITIGAFLTGLPWITMIRKTFAQFEVPEPRWLAKFLTFGAVVGPAILSYIALLSVFFTEVKGEHEGVFRVALEGPGWLHVFLILLAYATATIGWFLLERSYRRKK